MNQTNNHLTRMVSKERIGNMYKINLKNLLTTALVLFVICSLEYQANAQNWNLVYSEDFTTDPFTNGRWQRDDPNEVFWENGQLHGVMSNCPGTAAWATNFSWDNSAFRLEWEWHITSCDWSAAAEFGIYDADMSYNNTLLGAEVGLVDQGHHTTLVARAGENFDHLNSWNTWQPPVYVKNALEYDPASGHVWLEVTDGNTGQVIDVLEFFTTIQFPSNMDYLGFSRRHMNCYNSNRVDFTIDNIRFYTEGPSDCLALDVQNLIAGQKATFTVTGGTPGAQVAILWSNKDGQFITDNGIWCVDFGFFLPGDVTSKLVSMGRFDQNGEYVTHVKIPAGASGMDIRFQSAESDTCPDPCMSNIWQGVVQ